MMLGRGGEGDVYYVWEGIYGNSLAGLDSDPRHPFLYLSADSRHSSFQQLIFEKPHSHTQKLGLTQLLF